MCLILITITGSIFFFLKDILFFTSYVAGSSSFPQPLTAQEEREYLDRFTQGDEEAKNILIERNLRLVAHIVKKYNNTGKENDDLISIGTIGLIKAITTFNREKGTRLATYAARCIENEILMTIRSSKKQKSEVSLQDPIGIDREGNEISLIDILGSDSDEVFEQVELKLQVKKLYESLGSVLKTREKLVIQLRYGLINGNYKTQREIAQILGISRSYVSRIEKRAVHKLSKEMNL